MFKKFIHILMLAALSCSCVKENIIAEEVCPGDEIGVEHDGKVTLGFNVSIDGAEGSVATRSLAETPDIRNIYVAVFDASGYKLSEYVKANPITAGPANDTEYQFTIQLKTSTKKRILHFIANGPKEIRFGTEQEVIGALYSRYDADESDEYSRKDAYWQRIEFDKIAPRPEGADDGSQEWQDYNSMVSTLSNLKLIRNFSKVTLSKRPFVDGDSEDFENFKILGMWFVNFPDRGSVAPYNRNTGMFGTDLSGVRTKKYLDYQTMADVEDPQKGNYQGFTLASTNFLTPSAFVETGDAQNMIPATRDTACGYVYEREKALTSPMYLIAKCEYKGEETYYKIAMQDDKGSFYAMLRNFNYGVQIQNVTAAGYQTAQAALEGAPTGDISVNVDYQDLPNISDGDARITVSATKILVVAPNGESTTASFWYKYEPDITDHSDTGIHNDLWKEDDDEWNEGNPHVLISYENTAGSSGAVIDSLSVASGDDGGNRLVTITTTNASANPKTQTVTIEGRQHDGVRYQTITRTVQIVLRDALEMELSASPNPDADGNAYVLKEKAQPVVVNIGIENGLPSSMFPLVFKIDPLKNTLTPDNDYSSVQELPANYGTDDTGHPTYWFEKSVSWPEYESAPLSGGVKTIYAYFKTLTADSDTDLIVSNDSFKPDTVTLSTFDPAHFATAALSASTHKVGVSETFTFSLDKNFTGDIFLDMKGFEPAPSVTGITYLGTDADGNRQYKMPLSGYTSGDEISIEVVPYRGGVAFISLSAHLFVDKTVNVANVDDSPIAIDLTDVVAGNVKSNVVITSYGSEDSYVRAMIVANWYDKDGNIVAPWDESQGTFSGLPGSGWTKNGNIYYYGSKLSQYDSPSALFTSYTKPSVPPVEGAHLEMTIMVQAIPYVSGKTCVQAFSE